MIHTVILVPLLIATSTAASTQAVTAASAVAATSTAAASSAIAAREAWRFRAGAGAQIDSSSHGVIDLGAAYGPFSLELFTDTVELRFEQKTRTGRAWIAARGEAGAAGLFVAPWTNGAPDSSRAITAYYAGADAGGDLYLPHGFYLGLEGSLRRWFFRARDTTMTTIPRDRWVFSPSAIAGYWSEIFHAYARGGLDLVEGEMSARITLDARLHPRSKIAPLLELRAGWAEDQDDTVKTRLGGLNPYVVPLAGAGWAEFWVERYVAVRAGPVVDIEGVRIALVIDGARFDGKQDYGVALLGHTNFGRFFVDGAFGYSPSVPRRDGASRASLWILAGFDWTEL